MKFDVEMRDSQSGLDDHGDNRHRLRLSLWDSNVGGEYFAANDEAGYWEQDLTAWFTRVYNRANAAKLAGRKPEASTMVLQSGDAAEAGNAGSGLGLGNNNRLRSSDSMRGSQSLRSVDVEDSDNLVAGATQALVSAGAACGTATVAASRAAASATVAASGAVAGGLVGAVCNTVGCGAVAAAAKEGLASVADGAAPPPAAALSDVPRSDGTLWGEGLAPTYWEPLLGQKARPKLDFEFTPSGMKAPKLIKLKDVVTHRKDGAFFDSVAEATEAFVVKNAQGGVEEVLTPPTPTTQP
jgi:hypothetical protein